MTDMREKIAKAIWDGAMAEAEDRCDMEYTDMGADYTHFKAADAILAALPGMIPELEWGWLSESNHGFLCSRDSGALSYSIMTSKNRVYGIPGDHDGAAEFETLDEAKAAANTHHRQQLMKALGISHD